MINDLGNLELNLTEIEKCISEIPFVKEIYSIEKVRGFINAKVKITFEELEGFIDFEVEIYPQYPLKSYGSESIVFRNKELISYNHVMGSGSICIHTSHSTDLKHKLNIDFNALKNWIIKYYINKDKDKNYEHIIVSESPINESYYAYIFTDVKRKFRKGEFGEVIMSHVRSGGYKSKSIANFVVQKFIPFQCNPVECEWSNIYNNYALNNNVYNGFYIFLENVPAKHNRFIFNNWQDFTDLISVEYLEKLYEYEQQANKQEKSYLVPLFIGYRTIETEIHWQVAMLEIGKFPLKKEDQEINRIYRPVTVLKDEKINWAISRNSSYRYFFGRGAFCGKITESKILIIGVGAIGSMIAKTLTRGGCKFIDFFDYDIKEPENVCRSEYFFKNGVTNKTEELRHILSEISPFVNIQLFENNYFEDIIKIFHKEEKYKIRFIDEINKYDLVFDCTTDNDLMYVLDSLDLNTDLINLSITNHARELVCAFHPNIYRFVINQFENVLENDVEDLYNPTGCWSPTFKASYNDINVLVQLALKHINNLFEKGMPKNNFVIKSDDKYPSNLNVMEF